MMNDPNFGQDHYGWAPAFQDYKQILEQLRSPEDMIVYEAVMALQNQLSIAQENTLSNFAVDQYLVALIEILKKPPFSDVSNEINMFAIQCLTNLMDIFPNICNNIVTHGGVKCMAQVLERSMGFIDLNEACIKALEKISLENPYAILTSGAMTLVLNMMDFFEISTQKKIISIILNISRHSANETDLNDNLLSLVPCLCMLIHSRGGPDSASKIESVSQIILRICESVFRFISPHTQLDKVQVQFDKIGATGIVDALLQALSDYCEYENTMRASLQSNPQQNQQTQKIMTGPTIQNILKILSLCATYSLNLTKQLLDFNILKTTECFLPSTEDQKSLNFSLDNYPFIIDTVSLLDSLIPQREEDQQTDPLLAGEPPAQTKIREKFEKDRRALYMEPKQQQLIFYAAEKLLPKIFNVHENNFQAAVRNKTLKTIDKLILLFNEELLTNFIEPYCFAKFIHSNLRANQISSIIICLQMIDKLMKSNPKNYILPLIREGVPQFIKTISTIENLEKVTGQSFAEVESIDKHEAMLLEAKNMLAKGPALDSSADQQIHFQQTIQKYMELARLGQNASAAPLTHSKQQLKIAQTIVTLGTTLRQQFFENDEFLKIISSGEDMLNMTHLKELATGLIEEAKKKEFDFQANLKLLKDLANALTKSGKSMMSYELKESGLLEAIKVYLTMTPQQIELYCQKKKTEASGEEVKHSEELQITSMAKRVNKLSKKEARSFIQRLKIFLHVILLKINQKQSLVELVNLCQDILSQSENLIFEQVQQPGLFSSDPYGNPFGNAFSHQQISDPNQSMLALKQLTKRMRVNLVYDPEKTTVNQKHSPQPSREAAMSGVQNELLPSEPLLQPPPLNKASSHHPAFHQLADTQNKGGSQEPTSKVFDKRNFLYTELKQVMVSVEQCASLFLLEDFLRNRIKTIEDVKNLKIPQQSLYGNVKQSATSAKSYGGHRVTRHIVDRCIDRFRDLMEMGGTREEIHAISEEFAQWVMEQIFNTTSLDHPALNTLDQIDVIRQFEIHAMQLMDDFYQDHANEEDAIQERLLAGEAVKDVEGDLDFDDRMFEFQNTINRVRDLFRRRKDQEGDAKKKSPSPKKAESPQLQPAQVEKKPGDDVEMKDEQPEEEKKQSEELKREESAQKEPNVEMTEDDQEEMEARQRWEEEEAHLHRMRRARGESSEPEDHIEGIMINPPEKIQGKEQISDDLEQLIKANGDDIEYEFFIMGEPVPHNQTIYEILKQIDARAKKAQKVGGGITEQLGGVKNAITNILQMLQGRDGESLTVHYCIKDRQDNIQKSRKDSILEFSQKRDRTKSEAQEEISVASINQLVQQLIEKEFQVTSREILDPNDKQYEEKLQLESSLQILKVLNFLCRNINLFSGQGLKFLTSSRQNKGEDEEMKEDGFQDLDLQIGISQIHQNLFHHHKLDSYILKNIQDPYNLISGAVSETLTQIFRSCPFLFPFQTRLLFFKLISFIGSIDMNRSIFFLRQFLKQKLGKLPPEDKNAVKLQKQKVIVDRSKVLECSFNLMSKISNRAFLEVEYKDEQGTGLGPTLEFYYLVAQEIKGFKSGAEGKGVWRSNLADNTMFPNSINIVKMSSEEVQKVYEVFRLAGMMIAKSISDDRLIDLPLSPVFWDLILGKKMNIFDLERLDPELFKSFANFQLLANKKKEIDKTVFTDPEQKARILNNMKLTFNGLDVKLEDLSLNFTLPGHPDIELKPQGSDTEVNLDNLQDYIDLTMHQIFHESLKIQTQAFKKGFNQIFPVDNLKPFASNSMELEDMICGTQRNEDEWSNVQKLSEFIVPAHGYHQKSQPYLYLLRFMTELNREERKKFLKFVTGSPRLPNGGFGALDPKLTVVLKKPEVPKSQLKMVKLASQSEESLPSVMTCQNYVKLPAYTSYESLKEKFEKAYNEGCNNFTLS